MTRKFFLFFVFFFSFSLFWGQSIQPSLLENHRKKICLKGTKIPYSGTIAGYLYYRDLHPVHEVMFQIKNLILSVNYRYFDSIPSTPYIQGEVINGKERSMEILSISRFNITCRKLVHPRKNRWKINYV